jgi:endonuclease I
LRYCGIDTPIKIWTDNGVEFFSGCQEKKKEWNDILGLLDASIDSYNPGWDVRKNLIERSHRSDDEELLIPF